MLVTHQTRPWYHGSNHVAVDLRVPPGLLGLLECFELAGCSRHLQRLREHIRVLVQFLCQSKGLKDAMRLEPGCYTQLGVSLQTALPAFLNQSKAKERMQSSANLLIKTSGLAV